MRHILVHWVEGDPFKSTFDDEDEDGGECWSVNTKIQDGDTMETRKMDFDEEEDAQAFKDYMSTRFDPFFLLVVEDENEEPTEEEVLAYMEANHYVGDSDEL